MSSYSFYSFFDLILDNAAKFKLIIDIVSIRRAYLNGTNRLKYRVTKFAILIINKIKSLLIILILTIII